MANRGTLEFKEYFGTLEVTENYKQEYFCSVKNTRPKGWFQWWVEYPLSNGQYQNQTLQVNQAEPPLGKANNEAFSEQSVSLQKYQSNAYI